MLACHLPSLDAEGGQLTPPSDGRSYKITAKGTEGVENYSHVCSYFTTAPFFPLITNHSSILPINI